jgi:hypothetical protein
MSKIQNAYRSELDFLDDVLDYCPMNHVFSSIHTLCCHCFASTWELRLRSCTNFIYRVLAKVLSLGLICILPQLWRPMLS